MTIIIKTLKNDDESYDLAPVLRSGYAIMGFTMVGISMSILYGEAWLFTIMGLGYMFLFAVTNQTCTIVPSNQETASGTNRALDQALNEGDGVYRP